jgi:hypothetical protein
MLENPKSTAVPQDKSGVLLAVEYLEETVNRLEEARVAIESRYGVAACPISEPPAAEEGACSQGPIRSSLANRLEKLSSALRGIDARLRRFADASDL